MWSMFTAPCLVDTVVPSINGSTFNLEGVERDVNASLSLL